MQENAYPSTNTSLYKFAVSGPESFSCYEYGQGYAVNRHSPGVDEYSGNLENPPIEDQATASQVHQEGNPSSDVDAGSLECKISALCLNCWFIKSTDYCLLVISSSNVCFFTLFVCVMMLSYECVLQFTGPRNQQDARDYEVLCTFL